MAPQNDWNVEGIAAAKADPAQLFDARVAALRTQMAASGHPIVITSKKRSAKQQAQLFLKGRGSDGPIVTEKSGAPGDESLHQLGLAADIAFVGPNGPDYSERHPWNELGETAKRLGLFWGGDWPTLVDRPHVQLAAQPNPDWFLAPSDRAEKQSVPSVETTVANARTVGPTLREPKTQATSVRPELVGNPFLHSPYEFIPPSRRGARRTTDIELRHAPMKADGFNGPAIVTDGKKVTPTETRFDFSGISDLAASPVGSDLNFSGIKAAP